MMRQWLSGVGFFLIASSSLAETPAPSAQEFYDVACNQAQQYMNIETGELVPAVQTQISLPGQTIQWRATGGKSYTVTLYRANSERPANLRQLILIQQATTEAPGADGVGNQTLLDREIQSFWWTASEGFTVDRRQTKTLRTLDGDHFKDRMVSGATESLGDSEGYLQKFADGRQITTELRNNVKAETDGFRLLSVTDICRYEPKRDYVLTGLEPTLRSGVEKFSIQHAIANEKWRQLRDCLVAKKAEDCAAEWTNFQKEDEVRDELWHSLFPADQLRAPVFAPVKKTVLAIQPLPVAEPKSVSTPKPLPRKNRRKSAVAPPVLREAPPADDDWFHF